MKANQISLRTALALLATATVGQSFAQFDGPAPLAWRWAQASTVAPNGSPVVSGDTVYIAIGQRMYALDRATGNQKWRYPVGEPLPANFRSGCVLSNGVLLGAADNKTVYGVDASNGQPKWQYASPQPIVGAPVAAGPFTVFALSDNSLMALNTSDGTPAWKETLRIFDGVMGSLGSYLGNVLVFTNAFKLFSIDVATRKTNWEQSFSTLSPNVSATLFGDGLYVNSGDFLIALSAGTGRGKWQCNIGEPLTFNPAVSTDGIVVISRDGLVNLVDPGGRKISRQPIDLESTPVCNLSVVDKLAAICTSNGAMNLLNMKTGETVWQFTIRPMSAFQLPTDANTGGNTQGGGSTGSGNQLATTINAAGPPILAGQTLLVAARDSSVLAFDKTDGVDLTSPRVRMVFPNAGDQINGNPPLMFTFRLTDEATGVKPSTVVVDVDGTVYKHELTKDGILTVDIGPENKNPALANGRKVITVTVADWMGNVTKASFQVVVDNQLPPTGRGGLPPKKSGGTGGGGGGRGGGDGR